MVSTADTLREYEEITSLLSEVCTTRDDVTVFDVSHSYFVAATRLNQLLVWQRRLPHPYIALYDPEIEEDIQILLLRIHESSVLHVVLYLSNRELRIYQRRPGNEAQLSTCTFESAFRELHIQQNADEEFEVSCCAFLDQSLFVGLRSVCVGRILQIPLHDSARRDIDEELVAREFASVGSNILDLVAHEDNNRRYLLVTTFADNQIIELDYEKSAESSGDNGSEEASNVQSDISTKDSTWFVAKQTVRIGKKPRKAGDFRVCVRSSCVFVLRGSLRLCTADLDGSIRQTVIYKSEDLTKLPRITLKNPAGTKPRINFSSGSSGLTNSAEQASIAAILNPNAVGAIESNAKATSQNPSADADSEWYGIQTMGEMLIVNGRSNLSVLSCTNTELRCALLNVPIKLVRCASDDELFVLLASDVLSKAPVASPSRPTWRIVRLTTRHSPDFTYALSLVRAARRSALQRSPQVKRPVKSRPKKAVAAPAAVVAPASAAVTTEALVEPSVAEQSQQSAAGAVDRRKAEEPIDKLDAFFGKFGNKLKKFARELETELNVVRRDEVPAITTTVADPVSPVTNGNVQVDDTVAAASASQESSVIATSDNSASAAENGSGLPSGDSVELRAELSSSFDSKSTILIAEPLILESSNSHDSFTPRASLVAVTPPPPPPPDAAEKSKSADQLLFVNVKRRKHRVRHLVVRDVHLEDAEPERSDVEPAVQTDPQLKRSESAVDHPVTVPNTNDSKKLDAAVIDRQLSSDEPVSVENQLPLSSQLDLVSPFVRSYRFEEPATLDSYVISTEVEGTPPPSVLTQSAELPSSSAHADEFSESVDVRKAAFVAASASSGDYQADAEEDANLEADPVAVNTQESVDDSPVRNSLLSAQYGSEALPTPEVEEAQVKWDLASQLSSELQLSASSSRSVSLNQQNAGELSRSESESAKISSLAVRESILTRAHWTPFPLPSHTPLVSICSHNDLIYAVSVPHERKEKEKLASFMFRSNVHVAKLKRDELVKWEPVALSLTIPTAGKRQPEMRSAAAVRQLRVASTGDFAWALTVGGTVHAALNLMHEGVAIGSQTSWIFVQNGVRHIALDSDTAWYVRNSDIAMQSGLTVNSPLNPLGSKQVACPSQAHVQFESVAARNGVVLATNTAGQLLTRVGMTTSRTEGSDWKPVPGLVNEDGQPLRIVAVCIDNYEGERRVSVPRPSRNCLWLLDDRNLLFVKFNVTRDDPAGTEETLWSVPGLSEAVSKEVAQAVRQSATPDFVNSASDTSVRTFDSWLPLSSKKNEQSNRASHNGCDLDICNDMLLVRTPRCPALLSCPITDLTVHSWRMRVPPGMSHTSVNWQTLALCSFSNGVTLWLQHANGEVFCYDMRSSVIRSLSVLQKFACVAASPDCVWCLLEDSAAAAAADRDDALSQIQKGLHDGLSSINQGLNSGLNGGINALNESWSTVTQVFTRGFPLPFGKASRSGKSSTPPDTSDEASPGQNSKRSATRGSFSAGRGNVGGTVPIIYARIGVCSAAPHGVSWRPISIEQLQTHKLVHISLGTHTAWCVDTDGRLFMRFGVRWWRPPDLSLEPAWLPVDLDGLPRRNGTSASRATDGANIVRVYVNVADDLVWCVTATGEVFARAEVGRAAPLGTRWTRLDATGNVRVRSLALGLNDAYALDFDGRLYHRINMRHYDSVTDSSGVSHASPRRADPDKLAEYQTAVHGCDKHGWSFGTRWELIVSPRLKAIVCTPDGHVFGLSRNGELYEHNFCRPFAPMPSARASISQVKSSSGAAESLFLDDDASSDELINSSSGIGTGTKFAARGDLVETPSTSIFT